jgi:hypothetical protein
MTASEDANIPQTVKVVSYFIKQVGFPVVAFLLMFYQTFYSLQKLTESVNAQTRALIELSTATRQLQEQAKADHSSIKDKIDDVFRKSIIQ